MSQPQRLLRLDDAAKMLDVPVASLKTVAQKHGFMVRMGRSLRIESDRIGELIEKCRNKPREQDSTSTITARTGTSGTPANQIDQRALQAAQKLKKPSARTSQQKGAQVLPMTPKE